jgi:RNA polymerase subunit RPABC4/transcription elongation factor Spt4
MSEWYYQVLGEIYGPVDEGELREKIQAGQLPPDTMVGSSREGPWEAAHEKFGIPTGNGDPAEAPLPIDSGEPYPAAESAAGFPLAASVSPDSKPGDFGAKSPLALRPCSDCGWMVSREASICPRCGRIFHESSSVLTYHGEHPVSVMVFFAILAIVFLIGSPVVVYFVSSTLLNAIGLEGENIFLLSGGVMAAYTVSMIVCALLGGAVGKPRMAYVTGLLLGLFFGPLGVFVAYAIDKRPQCPHCSTRLNGLARQCPMCHARLLWRVVPSWV